MKHMSKRFHIALIAAALPLAACDRSSARVSTADSLLSRDLTLAAATPSTTAAPLLGDTASATNNPLALPKATTPPVTAPPAMVPPPAAQPTPPTTAVNPPPAASPQSAVAAAAALNIPPPGLSGDAPHLLATANRGASTAAGTGTALRELTFGTTLTGRTNSQICSRANRPGDRMVITTTADVYGANGAKLPAGSQIVVELTEPEAGSDFSFRARSVQVDTGMLPVFGTVRVEAKTTDRKTEKDGAEKQSVFGAAMKGAILGGLLGGRKGAMIGAAGGVTAGTVANRRNTITEQCLESGISLSVILSAPLVLGQGTP